MDTQRPEVLTHVFNDFGGAKRAEGSDWQSVNIIQEHSLLNRSTQLRIKDPNSFGGNEASSQSY